MVKDRGIVSPASDLKRGKSGNNCSKAFHMRTCPLLPSQHTKDTDKTHTHTRKTHQSPTHTHSINTEGTNNTEVMCSGLLPY